MHLGLAALFKAAYPACWTKHTQCSEELLGSLTYSLIAGIIFGMLSVGFIADRIGRKRGSIMTASIMFVGKWASCGATVASGLSILGSTAWSWQPGVAR